MFVRIAPVIALIVTLVPVAAGAQFASATPVVSSGITVIGRGVVRVHADELRFNATIFPTNGRPPVAVDADGAAEAIAKALRDGGVSDATSGFSGAYNVNGPRTITGSIRKPTRDAIDALVKRGNVAAAAYPGMALQNIGLSFTVDDCSAAEARAQDAALGDARARAERAAHAAGLHVGAVLAISEANSSGGIGGGNCATKPDSATAAFTGQQRIDSDSTTGDIFLTVTASVTFAIVR